MPASMRLKRVNPAEPARAFLGTAAAAAVTRTIAPR
jgi:hypothetical protein